MIGPLLGIALMMALGGDFRAVFWFAVLPGLLAVVLLVVAVEEAQAPPRSVAPPALRWHALHAFSARYWLIVTLGGMLALARFSEAFLVLRAHQHGLSAAYVPAVLILMNGVYAAAAYPAGRLADRIGRPALLGAGVLALVAADIALALSTGLPATALGVALWGLHMGLTQGLLAAMVADAAPDDLRGTAFGFFNLVSGAAMLAASAGAGVLWEVYGAAAAFVAGAALAGAALPLLACLRRQ